MADNACPSRGKPIFKRKVYLLAQKFYIQDHQRQLLLNAHKYDFDIVFFDQIDLFAMCVTDAGEDDLCVVDLDCLNNLYNNRRLFLADLLQLLPDNRDYIYLQTGKQSDRLDLQKRLIDHNCLAYLEKPFTSEYLIEKLFTLFVQTRRDWPSRILYLGPELAIDQAQLAAHNVQWLHHNDPQSLNRVMREQKPDLLLLDQSLYEFNRSLAQIVRKNIEFDYSLELYLYQPQYSANALAGALRDGFDDVIFGLEPTPLSQYLLNRMTRIRTSKRLISQDRATGLLNKVGFQQRAVEQIKDAAKAQVPLALAVTDIDKFKNINDTYGHYFGDIVIKRLSLLLGATINERDLLGRFGGEEFVVLLWGCGRQQALERLDAMRQAFNALVFEVDDKTQRQFSFSAGVACYPDSLTESELFLHADEMLYQAKQNGRNQVCG